MLYTRYTFARALCQKKRVLEIACGTGQGLGYLAEDARYVVGGDCNESLVSWGRRHYGHRLSLLCLDAHTLPFRPGSFEVAILYEALYYLESPVLFLAECQRILAQEGLLLICTANREWPGFNPSRLATRYLSARELVGLLWRHGFEATLYGSPPLTPESMKSKAVRAMRRIGTRLHVIPKTMRGKEFLKRIFLGPLELVPAELEVGMAAYQEPIQISAHEAPPFKFLFAVANRR